MGLAPAWMVMIILARELAVTGLRNVAAGRGVLIRASGLGKAKMVAQVTAILMLLLSQKLAPLQLPGVVALWVVVVLTLVSGADYFWRFWRQVVRAPTRGAGRGRRGPGLKMKGPAPGGGPRSDAGGELSAARPGLPP